MKIRDLARAGGISVQAVRDYETVGLLPPVPRLANGHRAYTARHLAALYTLRALIDAGYNRAGMTTIMDAIHRGDVHDAFAVTDRHHADIDHRHRQLASAMDSNHDETPGTSPPPVSIGQAAALIGVRASTLRFWESLGLVAPARNGSSGYREFGHAEIRRLRTIRHLRRLGMPWDAIRATGRDPEPDIATDTTALDRERIVNARATALVWCYATVTDMEDIPGVDVIFEVLRRGNT